MIDVRCSKTVFGDRGHHYQCTRNATVKRDGKSYCFQHDPVNVAKRDKKRQAKWDAEWKAKQKKWNRAEAGLKALLLLEDMLLKGAVPPAYLKGAQRLRRYL